MDLNDGDNVDISISLQLTERTIIRGKRRAACELCPQPPLSKPVIPPKALYINGELVSNWDE